jgi:hypothetical protein
VQRWDQFGRILLLDHIKVDVICDQKLEPIQQFRGRRLLLQTRYFAHVIEARQSIGDQTLLDTGEVDIHDGLHCVFVWEPESEGYRLFIKLPFANVLASTAIAGVSFVVSDLMTLESRDFVLIDLAEYRQVTNVPSL